MPLAWPHSKDRHVSNARITSEHCKFSCDLENVCRSWIGSRGQGGNGDLEEVERGAPATYSLTAEASIELVNRSLLACLQDSESELQVAAMRLAGWPCPSRLNAP